MEFYLLLLSFQGTPILIRVYVPCDVRAILNVFIVWNEKYWRTSNIPGTLIWTIEFLTTDTRHEFFIEISFLKSSGIWIFKGFYEKTMQSSRIRDTNKNSIYHLVFPSKDKTACEAAFVAFCSNILSSETHKNQMFAFRQLEAMGTYSYHDLCVNFKGIKHDRVKDVVTDLIKSLPGELYSENIPAFCFILYNIVSMPVYITKYGLIDMEKAKALLQCVPWMLPEDGFSQHMNEIGAVLEQLYILALGKKACVISFIEQTFKFCQEDFLIGIVQKVVGSSDSCMLLYLETSNTKLENILLQLVKESKITLFDKILNHLKPSYYLQKYISAMYALLQRTDGTVDIHEKLIDLCKQKCSQCLVQITKRGDLKDLLEYWKIIQILNPALNNVLHSVVEKGILECLNCEAKLQTYDKHSNDFIDQVLDGPLFGLIEKKTELMQCLAESKTNIRYCVLDLLEAEKFQSLPDDSNTKIVIGWLQTTLQMNRKKYNNEERIIRAYGHMYSLMQLPSVQKDKNLQVQIDKLVFKIIEQMDIKDIMKAVPEIEKSEPLQKLFQKHISSILRGKNPTKPTADIIWNICGTTRLRVRSR